MLKCYTLNVNLKVEKHLLKWIFSASDTTLHIYLRSLLCVLRIVVVLEICL